MQKFPSFKALTENKSKGLKGINWYSKRIHIQNLVVINV